MEHDFLILDVHSWRRHLSYSGIYHYLWAVIIVLFITWLKINFNEDVGANLPFFFYIFAIFLSTYYGGLGPGILSLVLSTVFVDFLFIEPFYSLYVDTRFLFPLIAFIVEGFAVVYLITKQRRILFQKTELDKQKDDFISTSSHELNTPLTSMKIYLDLIEQQAKANNHYQYEEILSVLRAQTERLIRLVSSLLDITRLRANKIVFKHEEVDLQRCVESIIKDMRKTGPNHTIRAEGNIIRKVVGDEDRLCQVVSNFLTNAIKYSPQGGDILVKMYENNKNAEVSVKDSGIGIEKSKHKKIFERFYRVTDVENTTFSGLGVGLYLCSEIIKKHRGKIWVESERGTGSTFYFSVPLMNEK